MDLRFSYQKLCPRFEIGGNSISAKSTECGIVPAIDLIVTADCWHSRLRAVAPQSAVVTPFLSIGHCAKAASQRASRRKFYLYGPFCLASLVATIPPASQPWHGACLKFTHFNLRGRVSLLLSLRWLAKNSEARTIAFCSAGVSHGHRIAQAKKSSLHRVQRHAATSL